MKISQYLVKMLVLAGVKRIWGVTGDSLNGINDALRADGSIEWIGNRHEEVGAFAAGALAELTGKLAVCAGSCGPGNMHLINGLYNCARNRVPVLAIASDIPSSELGTHYFQETNPKALFKDCSIFCEKISNAANAPQLIETAMRQAILKKGVAVLVIPGDVSEIELAKEIKPKWQEPKRPILSPDEDLLKSLVQILNDSKKTVLFCGYGCKNAHDEVIALSNALKAPVVHALRGKECVEWDNPNDVGMTGLMGFASGYRAMENADTVLLLGTQFPFRPFYPKGAKFVQIDEDAAALGRHVQLDLAIQADVKASIKELLLKISVKSDDAFLNSCKTHYIKTRKSMDKLALEKPKSKFIHPQNLAALISDKAAPDAIFTADVGTPTMWAARYFKMNGKRRLLGSFNHGSMANALPMALGAASLRDNRQVIAFCGDGGFSMLMGDLLTLKPYNLDVKVVVLNNHSLGFVDLEMKAAGLISHATDLDNPSFAAIATACGIKGICAKDPAMLASCIDELLATKGPALLEVCVAKHELGLPPKITFAQEKGFGIYMLKALFNGYGDELVELAKTNLLR